MGVGVSYPEIEPAFGNWLSGFIDGEGHFGLHPDSKGYLIAIFVLVLRDDDASILKECQRVTGLGSLRYVSGHPVGGYGAKPQVRWQINRKAECQRLVEILTAHPLKTKKRRDFVIWCQAVALMAKRQPGRNQWSGKDPTHTQLSVLAECLKRVRYYQPA